MTADADVAAIDIQDLHKYFGRNEVLKGFDFHVDNGQVVCVVGPSGSGKSTLLHVMGTLERPTSGSVHVAGHDASKLGDSALAALRARHIGFVFQQFFLIDGMSALDNVAAGMLYAGVPARERRERARAALERVGLGERLTHKPSELSGGEQQRVAIARALANRPSLLLADEPTGELDARTGADIIALFERLVLDGTTLVVVTHDEGLAAAAGRVVHMKDGLVVGDGSLDEPMVRPPAPSARRP